MKKKQGGNKKITIDELAMMVQNGFVDLKNDFNKKIDESEDRVINRIQGLEWRMDDIAERKANKSEVKDLHSKVSKILEKIRI